MTISTVDAGKAEAFLAAMLGSDGFSFSASPSPSGFRAGGARLATLTYARLEAKTPSAAHFPASDTVTILHLLTGRLDARLADGKTITVPTGGLGLVDATRGASTLRFRGTVTLVRLLFAELRGAAGPWIDATSPEVLLTGCYPVSEQAGRAWLDAETYLRRSLVLLPELTAHPIRAAAVGHLIAACTLQTFPNEVSAAQSGRSPSPAVRRALAFMEANAQAALTVPDVAAAAGIGVRGLQAAFHRELGTTPLDRLRAVRLAGAHEQLRAADPAAGDRVASIAARWRFRSPGEFAARYRDTYGCRPSQTLRAAAARRLDGSGLRPPA